MWWFPDGTGWHAVFTGFFGFLGWAVLIGLIVWLVTRASGRGHDQPRRPESQDALDIARLRYARGDISKEEFEEIKRNLAAP
jgi:putative membrane protein